MIFSSNVLLKLHHFYFFKGPFIYYVITFLGFLDPPSPLRNHVFSTENNQKLAFYDPPSPPTSDYIIYEWSLSNIRYKKFQGRTPEIISLVFWKKLSLHKDIMKLTDL